MLPTFHLSQTSKKKEALGTTIFYNLKYNNAKYVKIKTDYRNKKAQF